MRIGSDGSEPIRQRDEEIPDAEPLEPRPHRSGTYAPPPAVLAQEQSHLLAFALAERAPAREPGGDAILYVGMNHAPTEGGRLALQVSASLHAKVTIIAGSASSMIHAADGSARTYDLAIDAGVRGFAATLGLDAATTTDVAHALLAVHPSGRDEVARIAMAWAPAEHGERIAARLVLSGHGGSSLIYGSDTGQFKTTAIANLARAMPNAASQVEDLFISACFQSSPTGLQQFIDVFPNLRTAQGYELFAPENDVRNLLRWEVATRGHAEGTIALENGGSWTKHAGFSSKTLPLELAKQEETRLDVLDPYMRGERHDADPHRGPLTNYYVALQRLRAHPDLPDADKARVDERLAQTLALRYYPETRANFVGAHDAALRSGYRALGLPTPDFARLDRKGALDAVAATEQRAASLTAGAAATLEVTELLRLVRGFRDLRSAVASAHAD